MTRLFTTLFLMGCLAVISACTTVYTGEITDFAASEEKEIIDANGDAVNVRVDVFARDTIRKLSNDDTRRLGVRYVSQITYTYPDGTVVRENVPSGKYTSKDGKITLSAFQTNNTERKAGDIDVAGALTRAWARADARLRGNGTGDHLPKITPTASVDAMLGAIDAVTN